jgi:hypothetical protein
VAPRRPSIDHEPTKTPEEALIALQKAIQGLPDYVRDIHDLHIEPVGSVWHWRLCYGVCVSSSADEETLGAEGRTQALLEAVKAYTAAVVKNGLKLVEGSSSADA